MAIYSGFSSRQLQDKYNQLLKQLIQTLSQIVISYVETKKLQPFTKVYAHIIEKMSGLESRKYSQPKFTQLLQSLSEHMNFMEGSTAFTNRKDCREDALSQNNSSKRRPKTGNISKSVNNGTSKELYSDSNIESQNSYHRNRREKGSSNTITVKHTKHNYRVLKVPNSANIYNVGQSNNSKAVQSDYEREYETHTRNMRNSQQDQTIVNKAKRRYSNSVDSKVFSSNTKSVKTIGLEDLGGDLSMEELMQRHPIIDRKLSNFRRKIAQKDNYNCQRNFPRIEEDYEAQQQFV